MKAFAFHGHTKPVTSIQFSDEGDLLFSASKDGSCAVWSVASGQRMGTFDGHSAIQGLHVNHSSSILCTAGADFKTILWDVNDGHKLVQWENMSPARSPEFSHDDRFLLQVTDKKMGQQATIHVYDCPAKLGQQETKTIPSRFAFTQSEPIMCAKWGPTNDTIYFCSDDGTVCIMDVETQKEIRTAFPHSDEVRRLRFDSKYMTLTTASKDKTAKLLDAKNLKVISTYEYESPVNDAPLSPHSDHVLVAGGVEAVDVTTTAGDSKFAVRFYHSIHQTLLGQHFCHFGTINTVVWHPKGHMFASGAHDGFVKLHMLPDSYVNSPGYKPVFPEQKEGWEELLLTSSKKNSADDEDEEYADYEEGEEYYEEWAEEGEEADDAAAGEDADVDDI